MFKKVLRTISCCIRIQKYYGHRFSSNFKGQSRGIFGTFLYIFQLKQWLFGGPQWVQMHLVANVFSFTWRLGWMIVVRQVDKRRGCHSCFLWMWKSHLVGGWTTHLKNISQNGNLPQIGVKIKNVWNHHLDIHWCIVKWLQFVRICADESNVSSRNRTQTHIHHAYFHCQITSFPHRCFRPKLQLKYDHNPTTMRGIPLLHPILGCVPMVGHRVEYHPKSNKCEVIEGSCFTYLSLYLTYAIYIYIYTHKQLMIYNHNIS